MRKWFFAIFASVMLFGNALAQGSCPAIVQQALQAVDSFCQGAGRNQACYGNVSLSATPREGVQNFTFSQNGDIVDVTDIASLDLKPMDTVAGTWGVAMMKLQANLPDSAPGQNVTFLLFGDVSLQPNDTATSESPLQAFYFTSGIGDAPCAEAPSSGILVQTPEGAQQVAFNVNGVDVQMGSTILFRAELGNEMTVSALEGAATIEVDDELFPVIAGTWARMPIDEEFNLLDKPDLPVAYKSEVLDALPVDILPREIEIREPLNDEELAILYDYLLEGIPPCGDEDGLFPDCEHLPFFDSDDPNAPLWASGDEWGAPLPPIDDRDCVYPPGPNDPPLPSSETRPFCDNAPVPPDGQLPIDDRPCVMPPGPNDPPLPSSETRPFCEGMNPPPSDNTGSDDGGDDGGGEGDTDGDG
jgi:hypothetical protein